MDTSIDEAQRIAADAGYIAKVSALGGLLVLYDGDAAAPRTWMECGRVRIQDGKVSAAALAQEIA